MAELSYDEVFGKQELSYDEVFDSTVPAKRTREQVAASIPPSDTEVPLLTRIGNAAYWPVRAVSPQNLAEGVGKAVTGLFNLAPWLYNKAVGPQLQPFRIDLGKGEISQPPPQEIPLPYRAGKPTVDLSSAFANADINPLDAVLKRTIEGFTTPESLATLPFAGAPDGVGKAIQAYYLTQTVPGTIEAGQQTFSPEATPQQRTESGLEAGLSALFSGLLAHGVTAPRPTMPSGLTQGDITSTVDEYKPGYRIIENRREAQGPIPIIGQQNQPRIRSIGFTPEWQAIVSVVMPTKPPMEPTGGQVSFASPAEAGAIPSARQVALPGATPSVIRQTPDTAINQVVRAVLTNDRQGLVELRQEFSGPNYQATGVETLSHANDMIRLIDSRLKELKTGKIDPELETLRSIILKEPGVQKPLAPTEVKVSPPNQKLLEEQGYASPIRSPQAEVSQIGNVGEQRPKARGNDIQQLGQEVRQAEPSPIREERKGTTLEADIKQYQELQSQLLEKVNKGESDSPEFRQLWQTSEDIKNKYGGMPPTSTSKPTPRLYSGTFMFDPEFYKNLGENLKTFAKAATNKEQIAQHLDAADNQAMIGGRVKGNDVKVVLPNVADRNALTFVIETGGDVNKLNQMLTQVQGNSSAEQAVKYARANFNRLWPVAKQVKNTFDQQRQLEIANGVNTDEAPNYIKHAYETRNDVFFDSGGRGISTSFKKQRTFATFADAVEAGFEPKTLDAATLVESRVAAGLKMVNRIKWGEALGGLNDPSSGKPIVTKLITQPKGTQVAPRGYQSREVLPGIRVAVQDGYTGIFDALIGRSDISYSLAGRALLQTEGAIKHGLLMFDTFHASRVLQKQLFLTGKVGYGKGLSLLEYSDQAIGELIKRGEIEPEVAQWVKANRADGELLMKNGLNVGRIAEALYSDVIRKELKVAGIDVNIPGRFNKWVFDKLSRGAMMQAALTELESVRKSHPSWSDDQAARYVSKQINVYFGNLGRQGLFKSATKMDALRIAFLAPQWFESMAQTELRAYKQMAQIPYDAAIEHTLRVGTAAKGVGTGLLAYVIATQILNQFTRHQFTWENREKDHKLDAYIPDPSGNSGGYWISPFSVAAEVTHDWLRYSRTKKNQLDVASQIVQNKFSPLMRTEETARTGRDYAGNKILGTGERVRQSMTALLPVPLPVSGVKSDRPGQTGRQLYGSLGLKVEIASLEEKQQDEIAKKKFGKEFKDLSMGQRVQVSRETKKEQTLQEKYTIAQHATDKQFETIKGVQDSLSEPVQSWLKDKKLSISGYETYRKVGKGEVKLTDEERDKLQKVVIQEYDKALTKLMNHPVISQKPTADLQRYVNVHLENARKKAWSVVGRDIQGNAIKSGEGKK